MSVQYAKSMFLSVIDIKVMFSWKTWDNSNVKVK